jgi:hypothetical protein
LAGDFDYVAEAIRQIKAEYADLSRRLAALVMVGTVSQIDGDKEKLTLLDSDPSTGEPFTSPMVRRADPAGARGQGRKERSRSVLGEPRFLINPGGEIGKHSRTLSYGPTDESAEPQGDDGFARVFSEGSTSIAIRDGEIRLTVGGTTVSITAEGVSQTGGYRRHDGKNVGKDHKHGQVEPGPGLTGDPVA